MGNKVRSIVISALRTAALMCASGTLIQTFIETLGFSHQMNYIHTTILQVANMATIIIGSNWADKGNIFKRTAAIHFPMAILFLLYVPFCFFKFEETGSVFPFIMILAVGVMQMITVGLNTVCDYKIPYFVYRPEDYGVIGAISGVIGSAISLGLSALISVLSTKIPYAQLMIFAFILSAVFTVCAAVLILCQKSILNMDEVQLTKKDAKSVPLKKVFSHPAFSRLFVANLFRGFASGAMGVLAIVSFDLGFDETVASALVSVSSVAGFAAGLVFGTLSVYIHPRVLTFCGSLSYLLLPLMLSDNSIVFLAVAGVVIFGKTIIDYAVPTALIRVVPVEIAGPYNAWRMVLQSGGQLIATSVASVISTEVLFGVAIVLQLISGTVYLLDTVMRKDAPILLRRKERKRS